MHEHVSENNPHRKHIPAKGRCYDAEHTLQMHKEHNIRHLHVISCIQVTVQENVNKNQPHRCRTICSKVETMYAHVINTMIPTHITCSWVQSSTQITPEAGILASTMRRNRTRNWASVFSNFSVGHRCTCATRLCPKWKPNSRDCVSLHHLEISFAQRPKCPLQPCTSIQRPRSGCPPVDLGLRLKIFLHSEGLKEHTSIHESVEHMGCT